MPHCFAMEAISHYPSITTNLQHETLKQGTINLFGHTHSKERFYNDTPFMYNVSLDAHDNRPVSIEQVLAEVKERYETYVRSLSVK